MGVTAEGPGARRTQDRCYKSQCGTREWKASQGLHGDPTKATGASPTTTKGETMLHSLDSIQAEHQRATEQEAERVEG